jgi:hypothetical protein
MGYIGEINELELTLPLRGLQAGAADRQGGTRAAVRSTAARSRRQSVRRSRRSWSRGPRSGSAPRRSTGSAGADHQYARHRVAAVHSRALQGLAARCGRGDRSEDGRRARAVQRAHVRHQPLHGQHAAVVLRAAQHRPARPCTTRPRRARTRRRPPGSSRRPPWRWRWGSRTSTRTWSGRVRVATCSAIASFAAGSMKDTAT